MIRVCDAIMGQGKSSSAISYMNAHPQERFIYITPYLDEAKRIRNACPVLNFAEPEEKYFTIEERTDDKYYMEKQVAKRTKTMHAGQLILQNRNVTTTHQGFLYYTNEIVEEIRRKQYTLIIDEDVQVISKYIFYRADLEILLDAGYLVNEDGEYRMAKRPEGKSSMGGLFRLLESRNLVHVSDKKKTVETVFWVMPPELISAFKNVFILTYMFEGQSLCNMLKMNHMDYQYIGVRHDASGYHFADRPNAVPDYARDLINKIHICTHKKLNAIGEKRTAISANWLATHPKERAQLARHIQNYFRNIVDASASDQMWTTFKARKVDLAKVNVCKSSFVVLNKKASNDYSDRTSLVYAANIFMSPAYKTYYTSNGIKANEDIYALSTMLQWIFRSAIRNGKDINIYIPSRRMRELLQEWLGSLANESAAPNIEAERGAA